MDKPYGDAFSRFVEVIAKLRDPNGGCPWDLEQTHQTLKPYLVEEAYEVLESIDGGDDTNLAGELGDLLLQVVLHAQVARDRGAFSITEVVNAITEKMIRRHPHVFGETKVSGTKEVLRNWEAIKQAERAEERQGTSTSPESMLAGVPKSMPALQRAQRLGQKAAKVHFDWNSAAQVLAKVDEEIAELKAALSSNNQSEVIHELGDVLFALSQLARWQGFNAEDALHTAASRFSARFAVVEQLAPRPLAEMNESELDLLWQEAKRRLG